MRKKKKQNSQIWSPPKAYFSPSLPRLQCDPSAGSKHKAKKGGAICTVPCRYCMAGTEPECWIQYKHAPLSSTARSHGAEPARPSTAARGGRSAGGGKPSAAPHESEKEIWAVPTVPGAYFDGRFLTFYQMQAAIFAAAPRMSTAQCSNSYFSTEGKRKRIRPQAWGERGKNIYWFVVSYGRISLHVWCW